MARLPPITGKDQVAADHQAIVDAITQSRGAIQGPFTMFSIARSWPAALLISARSCASRVLSICGFASLPL